MLRLGHYNDGKEKRQSHEISIGDDCRFYNAEYDIFSHDPFDVTGYGSTKEEALENFKKKFSYVMDEWKAFEKMLLDTNLLEDSIVEVDCTGRKVE